LTAEQRHHPPAIQRWALEEPVRSPAHPWQNCLQLELLDGPEGAHITLLIMSPKSSRWLLEKAR
jgi:hypothetical protein